MLAIEFTIPNVLPCSLAELRFERNEGIDVLIIPKPEASREFAR